MENNVDGAALRLTDPSIDHLNRMSNIALVQSMAYDLDTYIQATNGAKMITGKKHIYFEVWQYVAAQFGCSVRGVSLDDLSHIQPGVLKYRSCVELVHNTTNRVIGRAWASCDNQEGGGKDKWKAFSLESMAQTRAGGKVCRMVFGHLAQMAGYEATPLEEMQGATGEIGTEVTSPDQKAKAANKFKTPATPEQIVELQDLFKDLPITDPERVRCQTMLNGESFMLNNYEYFKRYFTNVMAAQKPLSNDDF